MDGKEGRKDTMNAIAGLVLISLITSLCICYICKKFTDSATQYVVECAGTLKDIFGKEEEGEKCTVL